jgi:type I restriction enzyme S subunit
MAASTVPLSEVLQLVVDPWPVEPEASYPIMGIYGFARGAITRPAVRGSEISATTLYRVKKNQIVYSRLKAFEGAYTVVPPELDGYFTSNEFPTFDVDAKRADHRYLEWVFRQPEVWREIAIGSKGIGARRERVHPDQVLGYRIALPSLEEQRRIVQRLDRVAEGVERVRLARSEIIRETQALIRALIFGSPESPHPKVPFRKIARQRPVDVVVEPDGDYQFAGVFSFGRGMFLSERRLGSEFSYARLSRVRKGDFVYPKLMAWEGALAVVPHECDGCFVSPEFPVFELDAGVMDPVVVDAYFRNPSVWPTLSGTSKGTNVRRRTPPSRGSSGASSPRAARPNPAGHQAAVVSLRPILPEG